MPVNTTFLPKTNGLVFSDRLTARANKGRVFLYTVEGDEIVEPPPSMEPVTVTINGVAYNYDVGDPIEVTVGSTVNVIVRSFGNANPAFSWSTRNEAAATFTPDNSGTTTITLNEAGFVVCTCVLTDYNSLEDSIGIIITFMVS